MANTALENIKARVNQTNNVKVRVQDDGSLQSQPPVTLKNNTVGNGRFLTDLLDVTITDVSNSQILAYLANTGSFENRNPTSLTGNSFQIAVANNNAFDFNLSLPNTVVVNQSLTVNTQFSTNSTGTYINNGFFGNVNISNATILTGTLQLRNIIPDANNAYTIGNNTNRFATLYLSGNTLYMGNVVFTDVNTSLSLTSSNGSPIAVSMGNTAVNGSLSVSTSFSANSLNANTLTINQTSNLAGNTTVGGDLNITGSINRNPNINLVLTGDISGSGNATLTNLGSVTITVNTIAQGNSVELGVDTTGSYVASLANGTGVFISNTSSGESEVPVIAIGQDVRTNSSVTFASANITNDITGNNMTLSGNLTVSGTTTYINTTALNVGDNIITLNADVTNVTAPSENAGIEINRGSAANVSFLWDETLDTWSQGNTTVNGYVNATSVNVTGAATVNGAFTVNNTASVGNTTVTGFVNATSSVNSAVLSVGSSVVANSIGITTTGFVNVGTTISVGANVVANTTALFIGNSTVNTTANSTLVSVANSTSSANITPSSLAIGISTVNATHVAVGANVYANASHIVVGNSTLFSYTSIQSTVVGQGWDGQVSLGLADNNGVIEIGRLGRTVAGLPYIDFHSSANSPDYDIRIQASGGNTTSGSGNLAFFANVVNLPNTVINGTVSGITTFAAGNTTVTGFINATASVNSAILSVGTNFIANSVGVTTTGYVNVGTTVSVGANVIANTTALFVGNSTVNTVITSANITSNGINANTITANIATFNTSANVGANVQLTTSQLAIGNATVNTVITSSAITGNPTVAAGNTTVTGFVNATASVNSAIISVGTAFIANTTGAYHTGTINAASHTIGTTFIANTTGAYHTGLIAANGSITAHSGLDGQIFLGDPVNGAIEVGRQGRGSGGTPYVDFHSSASSPDYDVRIIASGGNTTSGSGNLAILANTLNLPNTIITGTVSGITTLAAGNTTVTGFVNATASVNSAVLSVGTAFVANSTGVTTTGFANVGGRIVGNLGGADANTYAGFGLDINSAVIRVGDAQGGLTMANGTGFKIHDSGNSHKSIGQLGSTFYISDTSSDGNSLFPATRTDIFAANTSLATLGVNTSITGFVNVTSTANIGGAITARGAVTVNGALTVSNTAALGNTTVTGFINVSSTANVGGVLSARSDVAVNGTLTVANTASLGNTTITGFANVSGNLQVNNVYATGSVQIDGNLFVNGNTVSINVTDLKLTDNLIFLNEPEVDTITSATSNGTAFIYTANNGLTVGMTVTITGINPSGYNVTANTITFANLTHFAVANTTSPGAYVSGGTSEGRSGVNPDLGFTGEYDDGTVRHAGFFRDATDGVFKVFDQYLPEPNGAFIDTSNNSFRIADFQSNNTVLGTANVAGTTRIGTGLANYIQLAGSTTANWTTLSTQGSDTNIDISYFTKGSGNHTFASGGVNNNIQFRVAHTASSANYLQATGAATGSGPTLIAAGTDANVNIDISSKGIANVNINTGSGLAFLIYNNNSGSVVNYWSVRGSNTNNTPLLWAQGSDTNVTGSITSKGSGAISIRTNNNSNEQFRVSHTASAVNYINATGAATGVNPVLSAQGSDTNIGLTFSGKGTGHPIFTTATAVGGTATNTQTTGEIHGLAGNVLLLRSSLVRHTTGSSWTGVGYRFGLVVDTTAMSYLEFNPEGQSQGLAIQVVGGAPLQVKTAGGEQFRVVDTASAVNYIQASGAATSGAPYILANGTDTNIPLILSSKGTGSIQFKTAGNTPTQFLVAHTASAVNYVQVTGATTGNAPSITVEGSDSNIPLNIQAKLAAPINFFTSGGYQQFKINNTATSVNFLQVTGAATTASPVLSAQGTDTNIDLNITTKGTGAVRFNTGGGLGFRVSEAFLTGTAVNYIDASGRQTGLGPILSVNGSDTNVRFNITSKGSEAVGIYTNLANQLQFNITHTASAVNYLEVTGGATGSGPVLRAIGTDANVPINITAKAAGNINLNSNTTFAANTLTFTGSAGSNTSIALRVLSDGVLSFEGGAGQLFSIANSLVGQIFAVNDISGIPSLEVYSNGQVNIAKFGGNVSIGTSTSTITVNGSVTFANAISLANNLTVTGFVNATASVNSAVLSVGTSFIANSTGITTTGFANVATTINVGANVIANTTALFVGNSTVNTVITQNTLQVANATGTSLFVAANGNVGVGNSTPGSKLVVQGSVRVDSAVSVGGSGRIEVDAPNFAGGRLTITADPTGNGTNFSPNANVGIGNSAPAHKLRVEGNASITSSLNVATTFASGNATITGFANVSGNLQVADTIAGNNMTLSGNLTVSGTTTYINTTNLNIGDNIITLNADLGAVAPTEDSGFIVNRGTSANVSFTWDETNDRWTFGGDGANNVVRLSTNSLTTTDLINSSGIWNYYGNTSVINAFAEFSIFNGVNRLDNRDRNYLIANSSANNVIFAANGNVGIGTGTATASILHIRQDSTGNIGPIIQNRSATGTPEASIKFITGTFDLSDSRYAEIGSVGGSSTDLSFRTSAGGSPTTKMYVAANGNVGIGNVTPTSALVVERNADSNNPTALFRNTTTGTGALTTIRVTGDTVGAQLDFGVASNTYGGYGLIGANSAFILSKSVNGLGIFADNASSYLRFGAGGTAEQMRLIANGNLGIGTIAPGYKLVVNSGASSISTAIFGKGSTGMSMTQAYPSIGWNNYYNGTNFLTLSTGFSGIMELNPSTGMVQVRTASVSNTTDSQAMLVTRMSFAANGNIALGSNTTPTELLRVEGTLSHTGLVMSTGTGIDQIFTATPSLTLNTNWQSTGVTSTNLANGTYVVQLLANDVAAGGTANNEYYSGMMSWYSADTNSTILDEIPLHRAGVNGSNNAIFLATQRTATANTSDLILMISSAANNSSSSTYTLKFRRMI